MWDPSEAWFREIKSQSHFSLSKGSQNNDIPIISMCVHGVSMCEWSQNFVYFKRFVFKLQRTTSIIWSYCRSPNFRVPSTTTGHHPLNIFPYKTECCDLADKWPCNREAVLATDAIFGLNPLLHRYPFKRINNRQLLKTLWEKKKLLATSNFFFFHNIFYSIRKLYPHLSIFINYTFICCWIRRAQNWDVR